MQRLSTSTCGLTSPRTKDRGFRGPEGWRGGGLSHAATPSRGPGAALRPARRPATRAGGGGPVFAAALTLVLAALVPGAAQAQSTDPIWSTTITVGEGTATDPYRGYSAERAGSVVDGDFTIGAKTHQLLAVFAGPNVDPNLPHGFTFELYSDEPFDSPTGYVVEFAGETFPLDDATNYRDLNYAFGFSKTWVATNAATLDEDSFKATLPLGATVGVCLRTAAQTCPDTSPTTDASTDPVWSTTITVGEGSQGGRGYEELNPVGSAVVDYFTIGADTVETLGVFVGPHAYFNASPGWFTFAVEDGDPLDDPDDYILEFAGETFPLSAATNVGDNDTEFRFSKTWVAANAATLDEDSYEATLTVGDTLAVCLRTAAQTCPDADPPSTDPVWSTTITVGESTATDPYRGYSFGSVGSIADDDFTIGAETHRLFAVFAGPPVDPGEPEGFTFELFASDTLDNPTDYIVEFAGETFPLNDATNYRDLNYSFGFTKAWVATNAATLSEDDFKAALPVGTTVGVCLRTAAQTCPDTSPTTETSTDPVWSTTITVGEGSLGGRGYEELNPVGSVAVDYFTIGADTVETLGVFVGPHAYFNASAGWFTFAVEDGDPLDDPDDYILEFAGETFPLSEATNVGDNDTEFTFSKTWVAANAATLDEDNYTATLTVGATFAVCLRTAAQTCPDTSPSTDPIWSTAITVGEGTATDPYRGYVFGAAGSIADDDFTIGAKTHQLFAVFAGPHTDPRVPEGFTFELFSGEPFDNPTGYIVEFAGETFPLNDATNYLGENYSFGFTKTWVATNAATLSEDNYKATLPVGVTVGVCLRTAAQTCPDTSPSTDPVWSTTITVGEGSQGGRGYEEPEGVGSVADGDFTIGSKTHELALVFAGPHSLYDPNDDWFVFELDPDDPLDNPTGYIVEFAGETFPLSDAANFGNHNYSFTFTKTWVATNAATLDEDNYKATLPVGSTIGVCLRTAAQTCPDTGPREKNATGKPQITGTARVGRTLTARRGTIADDDGLPSFPDGYDFQWVRVDGGTETEISSATSSTYTLAAEDEGRKIKVKVSFVDNAGTFEGPLESDATSAVTGMPVWSTAITVGESSRGGRGHESVTGIGSLADDDFTIGSKTHHVDVVFVGPHGYFNASPGWFTFEVDSSEPLDNPDDYILEFAGETFPLSAATNVGNRNVEFRFSKASVAANAATLDEDNYETTLPVGAGVGVCLRTATQTCPDTSPREKNATGQPEITGAAQVGRTLTAGIGKIADADGLPATFPDDYTFQWVRVDGGTETDISSATSSTYRVAAADEGRKFKVKVSFTDNVGTFEGPLESDATRAALAREESCATDRSTADWCTKMTVRVRGTTTTVSGPRTTPSGTLYGFIGGQINPLGALDNPKTIVYRNTTYAVSSIVLSVSRDEPHRDHMYLAYDASIRGFALAGRRLPSGTVLRIGEAEFDEASGRFATGGLDNSAGEYRWDRPADFGWIDGQRVTVSAEFAPTSGRPRISGTPQVGNTLRATLGSIEDSDGLPTFPDDYDFQWVRVDGGTETDIGGETSSTYRLVSADEGKKLKVKVSFTDNGGTDVGPLESGAYPSGSATVVSASAPSPQRVLLDTELTVRGYASEQGCSGGSDCAEAMGDNTFVSTDASGLARNFEINKLAFVRTSFGRTNLDLTFFQTRLSNYEIANLVIELDGERFVFDDAAAGGCITRLWQDETLHWPTGRSVSVRILDTYNPSNNSTPRLGGTNGGCRPRITMRSTEATEGEDAALDFIVRLSPASNEAVTVDYRTQDGKARAGSDYESTQGTLTFAAGESVKTISVPIVNDGAEDSNEDMFLTLHNGVGAEVYDYYTSTFGTATATGTIKNSETGNPASQVSVSDAEATKGDDASLEFVVTLSPAAADTVTVDYATSDGTATAGTDYTAASGTLTFLPGDTTKTIPVSIEDDDADDGGETVNLRLSNPSGAELGDGTAVGTIADPATLSVSDAEATEGDDASLDFVVTLSSPAADTVTVDYATSDGTATAGTDYTAASGKLTFLPGDTTKTIPVAVEDDEVAEDGGETVNLTLSNASGVEIGDGTAVGTIADPVTRRLSVSDAESTEGDDASLDFVVTLSPAAADTVTVDYATSDGTATAGTDYTAASGTLTFLPGDSTKTIPVPVEDDEVEEDGGETVNLTLSNASGAEIGDGEAVGTIRDPSGPLTAEFQHVPESHDGSTAFTFRIAFSEALAQGMKAGLRQQLSRSGAGLKTILRVDDRLDLFEVKLEPTGYDDVIVSLGPSPADCAADGAVCTSGGTALTGTVTDTVRGPPSVLTVADAGATEGDDASLDFVVTLSPAASDTVTVDYATSDGTATAATDYTAASGTLTFLPGDTTKTIPVPVEDDEVEEDGGETVNLTLSNASGAEIGDGTAVGTITDPVTFRLSASDAEATEGDDASLDFVVTLSPAATDTVTVDYATSDGTATAGTDYTTASGTLTFLPGDATKTIPVAVEDDEVVEEDGETVNLTLSNASGAEIGDGAAVGTIKDPVTLRLSASDAEATEGDDASLDFVVTLSPAGTDTVTVDYATSDGTASAGSDYTAASGRLTFLPGDTTKTVSVAVEDDEVEEDDGETVNLTLSNASGAEIGDGTAVGTIRDASDALTAEFQRVPESHDGSTAFTFRIAFSKELAQGMKAGVRRQLSRSGADLKTILRVNDRLDLFEVKLEPQGDDDVIVSLAPSPTDCAADGAVCTSDGTALTGTVTATVRGPLPVLTVADADAAEGDDASLDFAVTLSREASHTVTVDYATSDGTATAGTDYTAASGKLTFLPGDTTKTIPVAVEDDEVAEDGGETVNLTLSNASGAEIGDGSAVGTIADPEEAPDPLTALFRSVPASHDGEPFTFDLVFSEDVTGLSYSTLRDDAFTVTNGKVTRARRADPAGAEPGKEWEITVTPDGDADVTITLPETTDCAATGAICIGDRPLSAAVSATVDGPSPSNSAPTGLPAISGTARVGETLTASASAIADADGLTGATFAWQWIANNGSTDADIANATNATYTLTSAEEGNTVKVRVTFTDDGGTEETLLSAATAAVAAALSDDATLSSLSASGVDIGTIAAGTTRYSGTVANTVTSTVVTATANDDGASVVIADGDGSTNGTSRTVALAEGPNTITVTVTAEDGVTTETYTVTVTREAQQATPLTASFRSVPASHDGEPFTFDLVFSEDVTGLSYATLRDDAFTVTNGKVTKAGRSDPDGAEPSKEWVITVTPDGDADVTITLPETTDCTATGAICIGDRPLSAAVSGTVEGPPPSNSAPTGLPAISGTARVGETLTASASAIADADGLTGATFAWQWIANDGSTDADIANATNATYTLTSAEEGETVKVRVTFTDDGGTEETLLSAATAAVAAALSDDATLSSLSASGVDIGTFAAGTTRYSGTVANTVTSTRVTATANDDGASVVIADDDGRTNGTSRTVALAEGSNTITVTVTAEDGVTTETYTVTVTREAQQATPLTASFRSVPASHDGEPFTFDLVFSEDVTGLSYSTLRDHAFTVTNGKVTKARRSDPNAAEPSKEWEITVTPDGDADVTITLPETTDCTATGAICIGDRPLSAAVSATVEGPPDPPAVTPLTAEFKQVPASHAGDEFVFILSFSEDIEGLSFRTLRDHAFDVTAGTVKKAGRRTPGSNQEWNITVEPASASDTVKITLPETTNCNATGAICTGDGRPLSHATTAKVAPAASASASDMSSRNPVADGDPLADALVLVEGLTPDEAAAALFGERNLGEDRLKALDRLGNRNGRYDLGDLRSWIDRCRRGEADCEGTSTDAGSAGAAALPAATRGGGTSRRTGGRAPEPRGRSPVRRVRRRRTAGPYALAVLLAATAAWSCTDGAVGPTAPAEPDPGFLTVELAAPAANSDIGVLLELEGPGIEAVQAPGYELYESGPAERHQIVLAGSLRRGPLMRFRVPDRNQLPLYRVHVVQVTGEDYGLRDAGEYRAVVMH